MACITVTGYPCSGKTTRSKQLKKLLDDKFEDPEYKGQKFQVKILSDEDLNLPRSSYDDSRSEKPARASYFTALTRLLSKETILILDGMNYIKGYRYQIYCAAREVGVRVCTLFVLATPELCREWHSQRDPESQYAPATFDNLLQRFEEPSSMVRWDSPLFSVLWEDQLPGNAIWDAVMSGRTLPTNPAVLAPSRPPTDALQTLEQTSNSLVTSIISAQTATSGLGGKINLTLSQAPTTKLQITLPARMITISELQRLKRQFVAVHKKAITQGMAGKGDMDWSEQTVAEKFVVYLEESLRP